MSDRSLFPFLDAPAPFDDSKVKKKNPVHKTKRGRVVYNRRRHLFTTKDLRRILKNILEEDGGTKVSYFDFLGEWAEIELMMLDLLAQQGGFVGGTLYDLVRQGVLMLSAGETQAPKPPIK